jgi:AcrR family transcriptional regulator
MARTGTADKRVRLVDAAAALAYEQGFHRTTLGEIAQRADVPIGNVYYYFRTKEAIGFALIQQQVLEYRRLREHWDELRGPRERLTAFVQMTIDRRRDLARNGCPIGSLCSELCKQDGRLGEDASRLFADWLEWLADQFRALGKGSQSPDLALHLLSALQGATVLTHSFGTPRHVEREARHLMSWIGDL